VLVLNPVSVCGEDLYILIRNLKVIGGSGEEHEFMCRESSLILSGLISFKVVPVELLAGFLKSEVEVNNIPALETRRKLGTKVR
jgi:hypothetical protein